MSVKELKLNAGITNLRCNICMEKLIALTIENEGDSAMVAVLDRNRAHLLMLYLQEHLGYQISDRPTNDKNYLAMWMCGCGRWHPKDFVCERI